MNGTKKGSAPKKSLSDGDWSLILKRINDEKCVPFLGAGASVSNGHVGLPTAVQLATALANHEKYKYPGADKSDLFRVAQYFQMVTDSFELRSFIRDQFRTATSAPTPVHKMIAALPFRYVITTNFDELMENAFKEAGKSPKVVTYERRGPTVEPTSPTVKEPLVYKLHGSLDRLESMIVTEDDLVEFLVCMVEGNPPLPANIKSIFGDNSMLFIGYGLRDWNIRVLLRHIRGRSKTPEMNSYSIQKCPTHVGLAKEWETCVMYWDKHENLKCFDMDAVAFSLKLKNKYRNMYAH